MFAGFTVIPFIAIYLTANLGWRVDQVPYVYLCGGLVTLITARWIGVLTDRKGKVVVFRLMAVLVTVPMMLTTLTAGFPIWAVLMSPPHFLRA